MRKDADSVDISRVLRMCNKRGTQDMTKFLLSFLESLGVSGLEI